MYKKGLKDGLPIILGYFPIAMTFGILGNTSGVSIVDGVLMSSLVYAGASQFMAISMISNEIGFSSIIIATFLMNFRHFIMGASIRPKIDSIKRSLYPLIGFFLTDETFSVASMEDNINDSKYLLTLQVSCYLSWVSGTAVGYLTGNFFPDILIKSMGIALYALFVALLIPACKKSTLALIIAVSTGLLNTLIMRTEFVNQSGSFVISVLTVTVLTTLLNNKKGSENYEL